MAEIIRMPRLSDTMEEGNIVSWLKKVGDSVSPGDILAEVETDKATMDLESFHEGTLLFIGIQEGPVPVDGIIAVIGEKGEDFDSIIKEASIQQKEGSQKVTEKVDNVSEGKIPDNEDTSLIQEQKVETSKLKASPLAKKIAGENNIDLLSINGTGEGGRIIKRDVENLIGQRGKESIAGAPVSAQDFKGEDQEFPLSQMRKTIAKRLRQSKFSSPHFYLTIEANMDRAVKARKAINNEGEFKISFNDIIVKAAALALRKHPMVNGSWLNDKIVLHGDINIGVAVAVEEGLVVPVIRHADYKSLSEINAKVKELAIKAREKKIKLEEMQGNTFTISNLGMYGIEEFTAIINPPDACILAVGAILQKPVVSDGQIVIGNQLRLTLSCDHRIVDGAKGSEFLKTLKLYLENPLYMLV